MAPTGTDGESPTPSGGPPEGVAHSSALSREQGAGSREQGDTRSADAETQETSTAKRRRRPKGYVAPRFDEFYAAYPRKKSPADAEAAWTKAVDGLGADPAVIIEGARLFAMQNRTKDPEWLPYPATWLNRRQWEDEPDRAPTAPRVITGPSEAAAAMPRPFSQVRADPLAYAQPGRDAPALFPPVGQVLDG
jgi:hypothetical protein